MDHVVIVGGGFGGLSTAQSLKKVPVRVTLIDRRNFHLFQPLLYQVATGWLSPANIASPLRMALRRQKNAHVILGEAVDVDVEKSQVVLSDGRIDYDVLVLAAGSSPHYFGNERWRPLAPGLKTVEDATEIRRRIFLAFEAAEREPDPAKVEGLLTFAIVGGGPTGVELAGALGEIAHDTLAHDFRNIDPRRTALHLFEGGERILPTYVAELSKKAAANLARLGVTVHEHSVVSEITPEVLTIKHGETVEHLACRTVIWAAGVQASPLGHSLAVRAGAKTDRAGRLPVEPDLTLPGHPEIFVIGDLANSSHETGKPLPGVAPVAIQEGSYVARTIEARLKNQLSTP